MRWSTLSRILCTSILFFGAAGVTARADEPSTQKDVLNELHALRDEVKALKAKEAARDAAAATQPAPSQEAITQAIADVLQDADKHSALLDESGSPITGGYLPEKGFILQSEDGNFLLHPWAYMQFRNVSNYREHSNADNGSDFENGYELRRMKIVFDGNVYSKDLTYQFIWNVLGGSLFMEDAWLRYHFSNSPFAIQAGQIRDPFDHEQILFGTQSMVSERSFVDAIFANGDGIVKGVDLQYGYDDNNLFRAEVAFTGGERNYDSDFEQFPTNNASWGAAGRADFKLMGNWKDYNRFTALGTKDPLLVAGIGADYTTAGNTAALSHVIDAQLDMPCGFSLYGAYLGRYTQANSGLPGADDGSTAPASAPDTYDSTVRGQAAWLFAEHFEPFIRYEYVHFDGRDFTTPVSHHGVMHIFTAGANYYFYGQKLKVTVDGSYLPYGSPITNTGSDILASHGGNEFILRAQFQLML